MVVPASDMRVNLAGPGASAYYLRDRGTEGLPRLAAYDEGGEVVELHGTAVEVMCIGHADAIRGTGTPNGCGFREHWTWAIAQVDAGDPDPRCPGCGGLVKSATVSFEQVLFPGVVERAYGLAATCDLMIAAGSSLQVYPAAGLPQVAVGHGARLVIVNDEETPLDDLAVLVVRGKAGETLGPAVAKALS